VVEAVRWPRIALGALGAVATVAALAVQPPGVFAFTGLAGIAAFIIASGCLAADAIPFRPLHAALAAGSIADAVLLVVGGQLGLPVIVPAALLLLLQVAPTARDRSVRFGGRLR
jgi:hypothetical protein